MGDHCEFDNFSCQDECNEGPYLINPHVANTETKTLVDDSDKIEEMWNKIKKLQYEAVNSEFYEINIGNSICFQSILNEEEKIKRPRRFYT